MRHEAQGARVSWRADHTDPTRLVISVANTEPGIAAPDLRNRIAVVVVHMSGTGAMLGENALDLGERLAIVNGPAVVQTWHSAPRASPGSGSWPPPCCQLVAFSL